MSSMRQSRWITVGMALLIAVAMAPGYRDGKATPAKAVARAGARSSDRFTYPDNELQQGTDHFKASLPIPLNALAYRNPAGQDSSQPQRSSTSLSPRPALGKGIYVLLSVVLLTSLWLSFEFMLPGRRLRDLRQIVFTVVGASGLVLVAVALYAIWHPAAIGTFYLTQKLVAITWVAGILFLRLRPEGEGTGNKAADVTKRVVEKWACRKNATAATLFPAFPRERKVNLAACCNWRSRCDDR